MDERDQTAQRYSRALVMGKFYPLHEGHLFLINEARGVAEQVTVLLGERPGECPSGEDREGWLRQLCPDAQVVRVEDKTPPDESHPEYWDIWISSIRRNTSSDVDVVVSSEPYGAEIARRLGVAHHTLDCQRTQVPISGTAVRADPLAHWEMLPPPVRGFYALRVALLGPESTGKTTLAALLADRFDTAWVPEYGREYTDHCDMSVFGLADLEKIGRGQAEREDRAAEESNRVLFCDTELLTTALWSEIYCDGAVPAWVEEESRQRSYALHLLLDTDIPWVDDGTRCFPHLRRAHFERIRSELEAREIPYILISGSFEERLEQASRAVERLLAKGGG